MCLLGYLQEWLLHSYFLWHKVIELNHSRYQVNWGELSRKKQIRHFLEKNYLFVQLLKPDSCRVYFPILFQWKRIHPHLKCRWQCFVYLHSTVLVVCPEADVLWNDQTCYLFLDFCFCSNFWRFLLSDCSRFNKNFQLNVPSTKLNGASHFHKLQNVHDHCSPRLQNSLLPNDV